MFGGIFGGKNRSIAKTGEKLPERHEGLPDHDLSHSIHEAPLVSVVNSEQWSRAFNFGGYALVTVRQKKIEAGDKEEN